jgi:hypothetical protein
MNNNLNILLEYRDKVYVYEILCTKSSEYYSQIKSIINIPLLLSSAIMTILNSGTFEPEAMKIPNIVINACTVLLLSLVNNFKVVEKASTFRNLSLKYMSLLHHIEDKINNDDDINADDTREIIKQYDEYISQNEFHIPNHIKKKVKRLYSGKKHLPVILNGEFPSPSRSRPSSNTDNAVIICDLGSPENL